MKIIGAGLSGLIAGALIPNSLIYERQQILPKNHGAVLRFRTDKIGNALGIPFKPVRVTKAIWYEGQEVQPHPRFQNMYSRKVTGEYGRRSISNIDPCDRWIAPPDFIEQLANRNQIIYNVSYPNNKHFPGDGEPTISTMPMPVMIEHFDMLKGHVDKPAFSRAPIWTRTLTFEDNVDLYQTIYFPGDETYLYRASFTGNKLILEFNTNPDNVGMGYSYIAQAFGLDQFYTHEEEVATKQRYGKIVPIDRTIRRMLIGELTHEYQIYSLGRFATWRNILLDDVFDDVFKVLDLINMDSYSRRLRR